MILAFGFLGFLLAGIVALGYGLLSDRSVYGTTYIGRMPKWVAMVLIPSTIVAFIVAGVRMASGVKRPKALEWAYALAAATGGAWLGGAAISSALVALGYQRAITPVEQAAIAAVAAQTAAATATGS